MSAQTVRDRFAARFSGAEAWANLSPDVQEAIGATALELVLSWNGEDAYDDADHGRPFAAATPILLDSLNDIVNGCIPGVLETEILPVPSMLGPVCRVCGCSEEDACGGRCSWVESGLCSRCKP